MNYNWTLIADPETVAAHVDYIEALEAEWITNDLGFKQVVDHVEPYPDHFQEELTAATYLVVQSLYPNVRIDEVAETATQDLDLTSLELRVQKKAHSSLFMPPRAYLRKISELFEEKVYHEVRCTLANIPLELRWNRQTPTVLGVAITRALDLEKPEVCARYLNGKTSPPTIERLEDDIESYPDYRERGITELESEYEGELREVLEQCSLDSIRLAADLESAFGVKGVFSEDEVDMTAYEFGGLDGLQSAGIIDETENGYVLTQSCFS